MIKKQSHRIPLYGNRLYIYFVDDLEEIQSELGINFDACDTGGIKGFDGVSFVHDEQFYLAYEIKSVTPGIIAHECCHFVNNLFLFIGAHLDEKNDEHQCYLLEWAVDKVHDAMGKLLKK